MFNREYWTYTKIVRVTSVYKYSNQYSTNTPATAAVDGDTGTYWQTRSPSGAYIIVELAEAIAVNRLQWYVKNTSYYAKAFTVAGSNDGTDFTDLFSGGCTNTSGWQEFGWENETEYKYIKVTCNTGNSSRLYTYELKFGTAVTAYYDQSYGKYLVAVFDGPVSAPTEADIQHFSVRAPIVVMGDSGHLMLETTTRTIESVVPHPYVENALLITLDTTARLDECWKPVVLAYDGTGSLTGYGRPVSAFEVEFDPQGIAYKGDQHNVEHIEIGNITVAGVLTRLYYSDYAAPAEHIEIGNITATGVLTRVDDI